ncbi:hypothetical protein Ahu01nite_046730 [Winogradskya humida]|uniref:Uncharacterized protein n=1 Tax=Winogradskya humida TaxID=113566 RepID=A0ABQ3ZSK6_9ACTN|nr:hypothetical protein Ahu01nite_046730 [Actinoplanes humidus]
MLGKQAGVSNTGETQRTPEGASPLRLRKAGRLGVHVRSPTRQSTVRIGLKLENVSCFDRDEPQ